MELSKERKDHLANLYHNWGIDQVRRELTRSERVPFMEPEVREFARSWIATQEEALARKKRETAFLSSAGGFLIGALMAAFLNL